MKKLFIVLALVLSGCATTDVDYRIDAHTAHHVDHIVTDLIVFGIVYDAYRDRHHYPYASSARRCRHRH